MNTPSTTPRQPGPGRAEGGGQDLPSLLTQVARGDHAAFEAVYDQLAGPVYGLVRKVLRDPAQSEEIAQEVLLEVWRTASRFDAARGSAAAWVMTIAAGLPAPAGSRIYQLWVMSPGGARSAGQLPASHAGSTSPVLAGQVEPGDRLGITVEPAGGTAQPTTTPVVVLPVPVVE